MATEGLFALELLVEALRVSAPGPPVFPAVALRFLDFPTLLLRPAASSPPLRPGLPFPFGRGKRCLFRWRRDSFCAALRRRPLRALLLALPSGLSPGIPRLLGTCEVSLAPAASELLQRPGAPASCGRRAAFPLRDSEGRPVGELVLSYRLSRLEASEVPAPPSPDSSLAATSPEPEGEEEKEEEEEEGEELEGNIFCPPALYYSRQPAEPRLPPAGKWERGEAWRPQEKEQGQNSSFPTSGPSLLHPASPPQLRDALGQLPLLSALLAELSVLTQSAAPAALHPHLAGLYQPPGSSGGDARIPGPSHSSSLKPAEAPGMPSGSNGSVSPQIKEGRQEVSSAGSGQAGRGPKKAAAREERGLDRNCRVKENRPPRRKLLYGLTNTLRLRLQQTNPDKLVIHERREQYRKKQMEILKKRSPSSKRKLLRNAGERGVVSSKPPSKRDSSKQNNHPDKITGVPLQKSAVTGYVSMTDVSSDLQKQATERLLKSNGSVSKEHPCRGTTTPSGDEPVLKFAHKAKYVKTQISAAFPSDANAKGSDEEGLHHKTTEHGDASSVSDHKPSPSRSVENNSEFIYSDDFVASPENTVYSEDFTSAECTGRDSEALDHSPEPLDLESPKPGPSDSELESTRSRISKLSQRAESTSELLPIPSASSPVQSLKRTRDFKNSKRTGGESVDSLNLAGMDASGLDEAQWISEEENRSDQHVEEVSTLRSKRVSSDIDLSIGKGQTSVGKIQAVTPVSSSLPSNMSDSEPSALENSVSGKEDDFLGKLHVDNQYKDISELVISKLPGYTM
ncbi:microtubule-associated protein 10 [Heliangelus exortis]|uniref:microtubule-associated protein 10 n=1 Tax=Heliangelus exortis TaxID=472823 RepID=UPI003A947993